MSKNLLDTRLNRRVRKAASGDIGIELELEGTLKTTPDDSKFWHWKSEGSLRQMPNGFEYVMQAPLPLNEIDDPLTELGRTLSQSKPFSSIRCSTHVHVNVLRNTYREIYNALVYYYMIEELLVQTQGPLRQGNLFCLRMSDAEAIPLNILNSLNSREYFAAFNQNEMKYGAVNLAAVHRFGSLEFRFLRPITSMSVMKTWCEIFYNIVRVGSTIPALDTMRYYKKDSPPEFLARTLSVPQVSFLLEQLRGQDLRGLLETNFDHCERISRRLNDKVYLRIPWNLCDNDLDMTQAGLGNDLAQAVYEETLASITQNTVPFTPNPPEAFYDEDPEIDDDF